VLPRELQSSRSPPRALLALDAGFPLPPGPDLPPRRLELDDLLAQDAFHRIGLVHGRFPDRARGRLRALPVTFAPSAMHPFTRRGGGTASSRPTFRVVLPRARSVRLSAPLTARGRCSSPTSATSPRHVHPRSFGSRVTMAFAFVDHDAPSPRRARAHRDAGPPCGDPAPSEACLTARPSFGPFDPSPAPAERARMTQRAIPLGIATSPRRCRPRTRRVKDS
jgi:hypothetical protein